MRRKREEEHENHERWLVSYADFITLMFAFFTIMYATSTKDLEKEKEFQKSVQKAFYAVVNFGGQDGPGDFPQQGSDASPIPPPIELFKRKSIGVAELRDAVERVLSEKVSDEERAKLKLELHDDDLGVRMSLDSSALFDSASAGIRPEVIPLLKKVGDVLKLTDRSLLIEGHTDNQAISTASYPSNWELAGARASVVVRYLIKYHGVEPQKLAALSYADQRPIASNSTEEGRAKNRRIEILLVSKN